MPIDGHNYLTKRGWAGKGSGLRAGSIARPIVASRKRDSKGLGKDRDDHFEFWDHVYTAAATTIKINVPTEEEHGECEQPIGFEGELHGPQRTSSGLVSTQQSSKLKRVSGPVGYDAATPGGAERGSESLLTVAKREAARRMLYSKFYRGEVLKGEYEEAVVSIEGAEGELRKKKRRREEGEGEGEGEEDEEDEKMRRKKKKKKREKKKKKELELGLER